MVHNIEKICQEIIALDFTKYWPNFKKVAFALYDEKNVYLCNHPKLMPQNSAFCQLERSDQFVADALLIYEECPTAIVNLELHHDYVSIFSLLVHELFHGYQFLKDEKRFPNEFVGITYPICNENVELRSQERKYLYHAVMADTLREQKQNINMFLRFRKKREDLIDEYLVYEALIESVEGPARYVELKAYMDKSPLSNDDVLKKFGEQLLDNKDSMMNIRRSCYSSGLFICLLLDQITMSWKENFFETNKSLYEYLLQYVEHKEIAAHVEEVTISQETRKITNAVSEQKKSEFNAIIHKEGYHLYIEGNIMISNMDPMNIIHIDNMILDKNFLRIIINNNDYVIKQPVLRYFEGDISNITKIHFVLSSKPITNKNSITIEGVGEIKGEFVEEKGVGYLQVCN
ncbi:hypothetical protein V1503_22860 [Bacillus sp. SCS-151]|uniref:hypothetical protein n=1 Tax=Nanhaiella sioensis TaxID=3115293 RepID=UPI00397E6F08